MRDEIEVLLSHEEWVFVAIAVRNSVPLHHHDCAQCREKRDEANRINYLLDVALAKHNGTQAHIRNSVPAEPDGPRGTGMTEQIEAMIARDENCPCWKQGDGAQIGHECARDEAVALLRRARESLLDDLHIEREELSDEIDTYLKEHGDA